MDPFIYEQTSRRIVFGSGTRRQVKVEAERLGVERVVVLSTREQSEHALEVVDILGSRAAGIFSQAVMHTPVEVTERALAVVKAKGADGVVSIGGGSTIGLGKAIALRTDLPQIVIPTTYAGSEMTPILGETSGGRKMTQSTPKVLPEVAIYDVDLTLTLPPALSATSGMNAIAHAVEALYANDKNPIISLMGSEAIAALARALPRITKQPHDVEARLDALYGAWLCGICLGTVGMALHHKLCHVLGGLFNLPHAEMHTIILPHSVAYNASAAGEAMNRVRIALGVTDAATGLYDFAGRLGVPRALKDIGMPINRIDAAVDQALSNPYWNPRPLERAALRDLLERAYDGTPPAID
jgi:alcohol dehydrogenase class IV